MRCKADGNRTRRTDLADQVDCANIDAEFERCRRYQRAELADLQFLLGSETQLARQAAVMRGDGIARPGARRDDETCALPDGGC